MTERPEGGVYDWYVRGRSLLESGDHAAAAQVLAHAVAEDPAAPSLRELLARAQFNSGRYREAAEGFAWLTRAHPADHYAQFGLGMASWRLGDLRAAVHHLALAAALRPASDSAGQEYAAALRSVRATLRAREAG